MFYQIYFTSCFLLSLRLSASDIMCNDLCDSCTKTVNLNKTFFTCGFCVRIAASERSSAATTFTGYANDVRKCEAEQNRTELTICIGNIEKEIAVTSHHFNHEASNTRKVLKPDYLTEFYVDGSSQSDNVYADINLSINICVPACPIFSR